MKMGVFNVSLLLFFLLCVLSVPSEAVSEYSILRTDMYPAGARLVFSIPASEKVHFQLPGAFDSASVRPLPSEGVEVLSFEAVDVSRSEWIPPVLEKLFTSIREKERLQATLGGKISAIENSLALLSGPLPKELKGADVAEYIESVRAVREKMELERASLADTLDELQKELAVLQADFKSKMPPDSQKAVEITAVLSGSGVFLVEAFTRYAEWVPFYRMNLSVSSGGISAGLFARARQKTGLLVEGTVHFHTSMPSVSVAPPELRPLVADLAPKHKDVRRFAMDEALPMMAPMVQAPAPAEPAPRPVIQTLTDLSTQAEGLLTGDYTPADFNLGSFSLKSETSIISVPSLSEQAWLVAESKGLPFPILPASAELSVDGSPSGKTTLDEHGSGSDILIAFGRTPRVKASKEKLVSKEGSTWTGRGRTEDGYTIEVTNGMPHPVAVTLKDRIPISSRENISVEVLRIEPKPDEQSEQNLLTWKLSLAPGEKRTISAVFRLSYPSDETVIFR